MHVPVHPHCNVRNPKRRTIVFQALIIRDTKGLLSARGGCRRDCEGGKERERERGRGRVREIKSRGQREKEREFYKWREKRDRREKQDQKNLKNKEITEVVFGTCRDDDGRHRGRGRDRAPGQRS